MSRLRVIHVGPLPPTPSGIADYSAELMPSLAERVDLMLCVADDAPQPSLPYPTLRRSEVAAHRDDFDVALYQLGNHRVHAWELGLMAELPGVTVLHDAVLHHLYADFLLARGRGASYLREVGYGRSAAVARATDAVLGEAGPAWYDEPLIARAIDLSRVTVVHSRAAAAAALRARPRARVRLVHHGVAAPRLDGPAPRAPFTVGTFGGLDLQKRIPSLLRAFDALRADVPDARLLLVGAVAPGVDLPERPGLEAVGRVTLREMETLMARCHVCVQLRWPTAGEASGAALRALRLGRPLVVSDCGWFAELPTTATDRVPAGLDPDAESAALARALLTLARDPDRRERMSAAALELAAAWSWDAAAARYVEAMSDR